MNIDTIIEKECAKWTQDKYAMYLRKSRADLELEALGEEETLARHKTMLYALAAKHDIHPDQIEVYHEIVSGESLSERPEALRLLEDVYAKKYKAVLVVEVERLARGNTKDQGEIADAFQFSGTHIITPAKTYDPNNEFDQEYFEFGLFMSRREFKTIRRRLDAGKLQAVKEGNFIPSMPPYGFDVVRKSKKERILVENPEQSKYVKMIFDWYTEEKISPYSIAKRLSAMGVPTQKGNMEWERGTIADILFNAHYIGKVSWHAQQTKRVLDPETGKTKKVRVRKGNRDYDLFEGKHKGFISEEQFWKVRDIWGKAAPVKHNTELVNFLSGIMVCCDCGRSIGLMRYRDHDRRANRFFHKHGKQCFKPSIVESLVLDALVAALKKSIEDFKMQMESNSDQTELVRHQAMVKAMQDELKKQESRKRRLMDSWEADDGMYTRDEFIERKQMYTQKINSLKAQIAAAQKDAPAPVDYEEKILTVHKVIDCIQDKTMSAKAKNDLLKEFIDKITYDIIDNGKNKKIPVLEIFWK